VESAVLIGTPAPSDAAVWRSMRSVVAGRLINVYSENDYILAFLYRTSSIQYGVAGIQEARDVKGVENVNVSEMVSGHLRYQYVLFLCTFPIHSKHLRLWGHHLNQALNLGTTTNTNFFQISGWKYFRKNRIRGY